MRALPSSVKVWELKSDKQAEKRRAVPAFSQSKCVVRDPGKDSLGVTSTVLPFQVI
jgi:hypothetical protein